MKLQMEPLLPTCAIIQLPDFRTNEKIETQLKIMENKWRYIYNEVGESGSLLLFGINSFQDDQLVPWPLIVAEDITEKTSFAIKNIFIWYKETNDLKEKDFALKHVYIIFLVHSLAKYYFNKDSIREPHIFRDIEWGGNRLKCKTSYHENEVTRYSSKGRDPGNVFYRTSRDDKGYITDFHEYSSRDMYEKIISLFTKENSQIITNIKDNNFLKLVNTLDRNVKFMESVN